MKISAALGNPDYAVGSTRDGSIRVTYTLPPSARDMIAQMNEYVNIKRQRRQHDAALKELLNETAALGNPNSVVGCAWDGPS